MKTLGWLSPDPTWVVATCDFLSWLLKNILHQHLLLGAGESDTSVARQPLWLLFCRTGPLTRCPPPLSVKVASLCFDAFAALENVRESKRNMFIIDVPVFAPTLELHYFLCCIIMFLGGVKGPQTYGCGKFWFLLDQNRSLTSEGLSKGSSQRFPTQSAAVLQVSQPRHVLALFFPPVGLFWIMNIQISPLSIGRKIGPLFPTSSEKHLFFSPSRNKLTDFRDIYEKACVFPVVKES